MDERLVSRTQVETLRIVAWPNKTTFPRWEFAWLAQEVTRRPAGMLMTMLVFYVEREGVEWSESRAVHANDLMESQYEGFLTHILSLAKRQLEKSVSNRWGWERRSHSWYYHLPSEAVALRRLGQVGRHRGTSHFYKDGSDDEPLHPVIMPT